MSGRRICWTLQALRRLDEIGAYRRPWFLRRAIQIRHEFGYSPGLAFEEHQVVFSAKQTNCTLPLRHARSSAPGSSSAISSIGFNALTIAGVPLGNRTFQEKIPA